MISKIFAGALSALLLVLAVYFYRTYLLFETRMFQQNSYRPERFMRWWRGPRNAYSAFLAWLLPLPVKIPLAVTARVKRLFVTDIVLTLLLFAGGVWGCLALCGSFSCASGALDAGLASDRAAGTSDVAGICGLPWGGWSLPLAIWVVSSVLLMASKWILLLANAVNQPIEKAITRWYYNDAARMLREHKGLIVIGVTGSYGKTSTKNYLYRILSEKYNTLVTPGNFNTTLGVVRTIREQLQPHHQVFIVEMGAKQPGDIREICDLVHPSIGIVASVGPMHLETFGSLENIQKTKFELIRALPADGFAAINADSPGIASYQDIPTHCRVIRYGVDKTGNSLSLRRDDAAPSPDRDDATPSPDRDDAALSLRRDSFRARNLSYTTQGSTFELSYDAFAAPSAAGVAAGLAAADMVSVPGDVPHVHASVAMQTHLLGESNIQNIVGACAVASFLGVTPAQQKSAVAKLQQVENRLFVSRQGAVTVINDAYNSNPEGAAMALDVLRDIQGGRKILITPGFVELGARQADACYQLGFKAAFCADILIVVNQLNRDAILSGARDAITRDRAGKQSREASGQDDSPSLSSVRLKEENILCKDDLALVFEALPALLKPGDVVLYENDLPDTFK